MDKNKINPESEPEVEQDDLEEESLDDADDEVKKEIICDESSDIFSHFGMVVVFSIAAYFLFDSFKFDDPRDDIFIYAVRSICPLIAGIFLILGIKAKIRFSKFGISTFKISEGGVSGQSIKGIVKQSVPIKTPRDFYATLECAEKGTTYKDGERSKSRHKIIWKHKNTIKSSTVNSLRGIPIDFLIPGDVQRKVAQQKNVQFQWVLRVGAPTSGINYKAAFVIPR